MVEPIDLWRGAWQAGTLGRLASETTLPPAVVERSRTQLGVALGAQAGANVESSTFESAAGAWLDRAASAMANSTEGDDVAYEKWELWLAAQRALGTGERYDAAIMTAIDAILQTAVDLSKPGNTTNVLGRLVGIAMSNPSDVTRQKLSAMFDSKTITARDLWALTSLIAQSGKAKWFGSNLVLPDDADAMHRGRVRDSIARLWPKERSEDNPDAAHGLVVDGPTAQRWLALCDDLLRANPGAKPTEVLQQLVNTSRLIEAADELAGQGIGQATRIIDDLEPSNRRPMGANSTPNGLPEKPVGPHLPPQLHQTKKLKAGQASGPDAVFTVEYEQAKSPDDKIQVIRKLRSITSGDLGPIDAQTLVHEAYRGSTNDIRLTAQAVVIERFTTGPNVSMEMLDQFIDPPVNQTIADLIQGFTDRPMPAINAAHWKNEAKLALVQHALDLRIAEATAMDNVVDQLIESYLHRLSAVRRDAAASVAPRTPQEAAELLVQAWDDRAALTLVSSPAPADVPSLEKRQRLRERLAAGPIQNLVARQLGLLDLVTYITVAEHPPLRDQALSVLREGAQRRASMASALDQSLEAERTLAAIWRLRLSAAERNVPPKGETAESEGTQ